MKYITVFITGKPTFKNNKHLVYTRFNGNINRIGETVALHGNINSEGMESEKLQLGHDELELLLGDLLELEFARDYAVKILREKYGMELGKRKTEMIF